MPAFSSGGSSYRSLSSGAGGSIRFSMPSRPAIKIAEKHRYGLHEGSGARNSTRLAFGLLEYIGMRTHADRLRCEYTKLIGASYPGTNLRKLLVVGLVNASNDAACFRIPPTYHRAVSLKPAYPASSYIKFS